MVSVKTMNSNIPKHIAIILDGNGRWAQKRGLSRSQGHYQGGRNVFKIAKAAQALGVKILTLFAFSTENWKRPQEEVDYLMHQPIKLFNEKEYEQQYAVYFIGRRDRIPAETLQIIEEIETKSRTLSQDFVLNVAVDYGTFDEIDVALKTQNINSFDALKQHLWLSEDVDLLIRTSGEQRLSNFLLLQSAYAELFFTKKMWPAFSEKDLKCAIKTFQSRHRRFGGLK
jgi:undecaprenyl diphosphate synthase